MKQEAHAARLSPKRESVAAVYFYGGLIVWGTSLALITTIGAWFVPIMVVGALSIAIGMSGGPWR
jgi:high-affinity Fe2+/Pb2+ permease